MATRRLGELQDKTGNSDLREQHPQEVLGAQVLVKFAIITRRQYERRPIATLKPIADLLDCVCDRFGVLSFAETATRPQYRFTQLVLAIRSREKPLLEMIQEGNQPLALIEGSSFLRTLGTENFLPNAQSALTRAREVQADFEGMGHDVAIEMQTTAL